MPQDPDEMILTIVLRRPVPDRETGHTIFEMVKQRLSDHPEVKISGHVTNHFDFSVQEPPS